jgi:hypothetical protein
MIDHHRHNLITKITKPLKIEESPCEKAIGYIRLKRGEQNTISSEQSYRINFHELQRLRLRQLQHKLIQNVVDLRYDAAEPPGWPETLREYVQALQDYDYIAQRFRHPRDPFRVSGERVVERWMLEAAMRDRENPADPLHESPLLAKNRWGSPDILRPDRIYGTRGDLSRQAWVGEFQGRLSVAAVGGAFLIGPMWLMVLHDTPYTALVGTTVFVVVFGLLMAIFLEKLTDVMSSTAAYAAVLVVFVGLTVAREPP